MTAHNARQILFVGILIATAFGVPSSRTAMPDESVAEPLRFQRIYVPADRERQWPAGNMTLEPIEAEEFENLIQIAGSSRNKSPRNGRIETATLTASLTDDRTISGTATFTVIQPADIPTLAPKLSPAINLKPSLIPFGPCGIAISNPVWLVDSETDNTGRPAFIGVDSSGRQLLVANHGGQIQCNWSLSGQRTATGQVVFVGDLPPATRCQITLEVPENRIPVVSNGVVSQLDNARDGFSKWQFNLGNASQLNIRLLDSDRDFSHDTGFVRQLTTYRCSPRGIEIIADFDLNIFDKPLEHFPVLLDDSIELVQAKLGDAPIAWSIRREAEHRVATIHFNEPIYGRGRRITIRGFAPVLNNQLAALPRFRPGALNWMSGKATLLIHDPLQIAEMFVDKGRQSKITQLGDMKSGEAIEIQCFSADCGIKVLLRRESSTITAAAATMIELADDQITGRMVVDLTATGDAQYSLQATVHGDWQLDENDITAEPADSLKVDVSPDGRVISLRLKQGLTESNPLRLNVAARIPNFRAGRTITQNELRMVSLSGIRNSRNVFHLESRSSNRPVIENKELLEPLNAENRLPADDSRLPSTPPIFAWLDVPGQNQLKISLQQESPDFTAHNHIQTKVANGLILQRLRVNCTPQSASVDRIAIHLSNNSTAGSRWLLANDNQESMVRAVRWTEQKNRAAGFAGGETWEVNLPRPFSKSFELSNEQTVPFDEVHLLPFVSVPSATAQTGTVVVESDDNSAIKIDPGDTQPIPASNSLSSQYNSTRAVFRYSPKADGTPPKHVRLNRIDANQSQLSRHTFAWFATVESMIDLRNGQEHRATFYLENNGRRRIRIRLPNETVFQSISIDGDKAPLVVDRPSGQAVVQLPPGQRFPRISVAYRQKPSPSRGSFVHMVSQPKPQIDVPVVTWRGVVHVPPGFRVRDSFNESGSDESSDWQYRLFGPFARGLDVTVLDPFQRETWNRGDSAAHRHLAIAKAAATAWLTRVGLTLQGHDQKSLTWKKLLHTVSTHVKGDSGHELPLWIAPVAVARLGVRPDSHVPETQPIAPQQRAAHLLRQLNLILIADQHRLILASTTETAGFSPRTTESATRPQRLFALPVVATAELATEHSPAIVPVRLWTRGTATANFPWKTISDSAPHAVNLHGWSSLEHAFQQGTDHPFYVVDQTLLNTLGWTVFLVVFTGFFWRSPQNFIAQVIISAVLCLSALLSPILWAFVPTSALLAFVFAQLARSIHRRLSTALASFTVLHETGRNENEISAEKTVRRTAPELLSFFIAVVVTGASLAAAQEPEASVKKTGARIFPVLITYGKEGKPITDYYYIPREFRRLLTLRSSPLVRGPAGWLIREAKYLGTIDWTGGNDRLSLTQLTASYDVEVYGRDTALRLPFQQAQLDPVESRVTLDGRTVKPSWQEESNEFSLTIREPGAYRLKIMLRPNPEFIGPLSRVEFAIPKLSTAELQLNLPNGVREVHVPSALGRVDLDKTRNRLTAHLGATEKLAISWRTTTRDPASILPIDVEQLVWLKVKPNVATIDAKLRINADRLRTITMAADKRLRLISCTCENSPEKNERHIEQVGTVPGDPQTINIHFTKTLSGQFDVDLSFLVVDNPNQLSIDMPKLTVTSTRSIRRWIAISLESTLRIGAEQLMLNDGLTELDLDEFSSRWDLGGLQPDLMYLQTKPVVDLSLPVGQQSPQTTADEHLAISVADDHAQVIYLANLVTSNSHVFTHRMKMSPSLVVEHVSVVADSSQRTAHWSQHSNDQLTIFLDGPVKGAHQLRIVCRQARKGKTVRIPTIAIQQCDLTKSLLSIYRQPSVTFPRNSFDLSNQLQRTSSLPPSNLPTDFGRHVASYEQMSAQRPSFPVKLNVPKTSGVQVTRVQHLSGEWRASVDIQLAVEADDAMQPSGEVDEIQIHLPENWRGPFELQPASLAGHLVTSSAAVGYLIIRPAESISGKFQFTISGPISVAPGDRVSVPNLTIQDLNSYDRFVVLPKQLDQQDVQWDRSGLESRALPPLIAAPPSHSESYRVTGKAFKAVLTSVERHEGVPQVRLADVQINWSNGGHYLGSASYDLQPTGLTTVAMRLPDSDCRLIQARVAGVIVAAFSDDRGRWRLPLSSGQLPQRIEVVFRGRWTQLSGERRQFWAPVLFHDDDEIDVSRTFWTIIAPDRQSSVISHTANVMQVSRPQQQLERFGQIEDTILNFTSEESQEVLSPWYQYWAQHLLAVKRQIEIAYFIDPASLSQDQAKNIEAKILQVSNRLVSQTAADGLSGIERDPFAVTQLWQQESASGQQMLYLATDGPCAEVGVTYTDLRRSDIWQRVMIALLIATASIGLILRKNQVAKFLEASPQVLVFVVGIVLWLWLWPSILGLLLVFVALLSSLRLGLRII